MGISKLLISLVTLYVIAICGKMDVSPDIMWAGLCIVFSAFILHEPPEIYLREDEDDG